MFALVHMETPQLQAPDSFDNVPADGPIIKGCEDTLTALASTNRDNK